MRSPWLAVAQLEQAELVGRTAEAERLLADARTTFVCLEAKPRLDRVGAAETAPPAEVSA